MSRLVWMPLFLAFFLPSAAAAQEQNQNKPKVELRVSVRENRLKFDLHPDGRVELSTDGETYSAASMEEFRKKYPEIAEKHRIDRFVPKVGEGTFPRDSRDAWEEWKQWFDEDWFWDRKGDFRRWFGAWWKPFQSDDLDNWVEQQKKLFDRFRDLRDPRGSGGDEENAESGPQFGLRIDSVAEVTASHLGLKEGQGAVVMEVRDGTPAHKAGLKKHDILLTVDGKPIADRREFRRHLREKAGQEIELEFLRSGKKESVKIRLPQ